MSGKILFTAITILFLVIIAEIIYLFSMKKDKMEAVVPASISPIPIINENDNYKKIVQGYELNTALKEEGFIKSSSTEIVYEFTIAGIGGMDKIPSSAGITNPEQYESFISFERPNGIRGLFFTPHDVGVTTVYDLINNQEIPIGFQNLQVGDNIRMEVTVDFYTKYEDNATQRIKITKLQ